MSDVEITYAEQRATDELERRLRPIVTIQDPRAFAERFIADLRAEGWKPPLKLAPSWKPTGGSVSAPNEDWRAARAALAEPGKEAAS